MDFIARLFLPDKKLFHRPNVRTDGLIKVIFFRFPLHRQLFCCYLCQNRYTYSYEPPLLKRLLRAATSGNALNFWDVYSDITIPYYNRAWRLRFHSLSVSIFYHSYPFVKTSFGKNPRIKKALSRNR